MPSDKPPYLGFGLGLRPQHYQEILQGNPAIDWFEIISENYMIEGGQPLHMLDQIRERYPVGQVQDFLGRRLTLENVSSYVTFGQSEMTEWEFVSEVARRADCWLLFDVNNVYVSAFNHEFSADDFLPGVPRDP